MSRTVELAAVELLRAILDLAEVDVRPTVDLLERLLDLESARANMLIMELRRAGMLQRERLGLTMAGLALASSVQAIEPRAMRLPACTPKRALRALRAA